MDIDFYQHLVLATWLFVILFRWFNKQKAFLFTMTVALLWEFAEYFYNLDAYKNIKHWKLDTLYDLGAALIACVICIFLLKDKK